MMASDFNEDIQGRNKFVSSGKYIIPGLRGEGKYNDSESDETASGSSDNNQEAQSGESESNDNNKSQNSNSGNSSESVGYEDVEQQQQGKKVTKESLGITKGDTAEIMVGKMMKGMKNGDYIDGDEMNFLSDGVGNLVRYTHKTSDTTLRIERTSISGHAALNDKATLTINVGTFQLTKQKLTGYSYRISGFRVDMSSKIATYGLINGNHTYYNNSNGKPRMIKIF